MLTRTIETLQKLYMVHAMITLFPIALLNDFLESLPDTSSLSLLEAEPVEIDNVFDDPDGESVGLSLGALMESSISFIDCSCFGERLTISGAVAVVDDMGQNVPRFSSSSKNRKY